MKTKTVYLVHACDDWGAHKGLAGIYTDARYQLSEYYQTQGITKADNFEIEVKSLNEWDW